MILFEDFENYPDFTITNFGDWTLFDGDGRPSYGIDGVSFTNSGYTGSYIVFKPSATTPPLTGAWDPLEGSTKYAACFSAVPAGAVQNNNDWLISPKLTINSGLSVNFWAKSVSSQWGLERLKVMISTTTNDPDDFIQVFPTVGPYQQIPIEWTEYTLDLSAYTGNLYIAFVTVSADAFALFIDNITISGDGMLAVPEDDFEVSELSASPTILFPNYTQTIETLIRNAGSNVQSKEVTIVAIDADDPFAEQIVLLETSTNVLAYSQSQSFTAEFVAPYPGNFIINVSVPNDDENANNSKSKNVIVYRIGELVESFEESTTNLPAGWLTDANGWNILRPTNFTPQEGQNVAYYGVPGGYNNVKLMSPMVSVNTNTKLSFWLADLNSRAGALNEFGFGTLQVKHSQNGIDWTNIGPVISFAEYVPRVFYPHEINLGTLTPGDYFIGFFASSTFNYEDYASVVYLDLVSGPNAILPNHDAALLNSKYTEKFYYEGDDVLLVSTIKNSGLTEIDLLAYSVKVDDDIVTEASVENILYQQTRNSSVSFAAPAEGVYNINVTLENDDDPDNNSKDISLVVLNPFQLSEDFTGNTYQDWTFDPDEDGWVVSGFSFAQGNRAAFVGTPHGYSDHRLITPLVSISAQYNTINFKLAGLNNAYGFENGHGYATLQIEYSADGTIWNPIGDPITLNTVGNQIWTNQTVDLSSLTDGDYYISFNASSTFDYEEYVGGFYLDMVYGPLVAGDAKVVGVFGLEDINISEGVIESEIEFPTSVKVMLSAGQIYLYVENWVCTTEGGYLPEMGEYSFEGDLVLTPSIINPDNIKAVVKVNVGQTNVPISLVNSLKVYPNPTSGIVNVEIGTYNNFNIRIFDITGKLISSQSIVGNAHTIDLSNNSAGVYIIQVIAGNEVINKKLIVR